MRRSLYIPCILLLMTLQTSCSVAPVPGGEAHSIIPRDTTPQVKNTDLMEVVRGNSEFAFALYQEISAGGGNLMFSPYSISSALAMTYAGARNQTADQMAQALRFTLPQSRLHPAFNQLALELASRSSVEGVEPEQAFQLSIANSLWGQSGFRFTPDFLDVLARHYGAGMRLVDFKKDPESARRAINDRVYRETKERIEDIIPDPPPELITSLTRLVLVNAVFFKAAWASPFNPDATQPAAFHLVDGSTVEVPTMVLPGRFRSMRGEGYRALELPYAGGQLAMLILLPDEGKFPDVEARLDSALVSATVAKLQSGESLLRMPKFKFDWSAAKLPGSLLALGMVDAFSMAADFSGMDGDLDLFISAILHKAFIVVDEAGTEAAASTAVIVSEKSLPLNIIDLQIDRPFFFLIRDNPTGTILFLGRVMNPA
jgi:serpin B